MVVAGVLDVAACMLNILAKAAKGAATGAQEGAERGEENHKVGSCGVCFHRMMG